MIGGVNSARILTDPPPTVPGVGTLNTNKPTKRQNDNGTGFEGQITRKKSLSRFSRRFFFYLRKNLKSLKKNLKK